MTADLRDRFARIEVRSRAEWRDWLHRNHTQAVSIWLVSWKSGRGPHVPYGDLRDEALCFGWIDSRPAKLDADRSMLLMSPRRRGSRWSGVNKARVAVLESAGLMTPAGRGMIERARADGTWDALNEVDALIVPDDLAAALGTESPAFAALPPSFRRGLLERLIDAKRPETRRSRIAQIVQLAARRARATTGS